MSFVESVAAMIRAERAAGAAPDGVDADVLATVLLEINDRLLERLTFGGPLTRQQLDGRCGGGLAGHRVRHHDRRRHGTGDGMTYQEMAFDPRESRCSGWHFRLRTGDCGRRRFRTSRRRDGARIRRNQGFGSASRSPSAFRPAGAGRAGVRLPRLRCIGRRTAPDDFDRAPGRRTIEAADRRGEGACPTSTRTASCCGDRRCRGATCCRWPPDRADVAAVIAMTPMTNSLATGRAGDRAVRRVDGAVVDGQRACAAGSRWRAARRR